MMENNSQYNTKAVVKYLFVAVLTILLWRITMGVGAVLITIFVLMALAHDRPVSLMFWMLFITLSVAGNRLIFMTNAVSVLTVRATQVALGILLAFKTMGGGRDARLISPFLGILVYLAWEMVISSQGYEPVISYLKMMLFLFVFLAMYGIANIVNRSTRTNAVLLRSATLSLIIIMVFGSIILLPLPQISYMTSKAALEAMLSDDITSLYQGMSCHSQVLGPMMGLMGTFVFADLVFSIKKWDKLYIALLVCCLYLVYKSSSRTGMGTLIGGMGMVVFLALRARGLGRNWKGKLLMTLNIIAIAAAMAVAILPSVRNRIAGFVLKWDPSGRSGAQVTMEEVITTRQAAIDNAMYNFKKKPWTGNGFQVSDEMEGQKRESIYQYLSAPIEKGVWIYAILEEGGIPGMVLFCGWLAVLFWLLITRHAYIGACVFFSFLVANLGEFSMFSTTYVGGFYWTLTFAATCLDVQRMKATNIQIFDVPIAQVINETGIDMWTRRLG